jgi:N-acetylglucosaminyl-diphospho-decaprenol L-rhamnosyltransferase
MVIPAPDGVEPNPRHDIVDVLVTVVTYNSATIIARFLSALPDAMSGVASARVVVVDNDSHDATLDLIEHHAPWVDVIPLDRNVGYGSGLNVAMRAYQSRLGTLILNPDAVLQPGAVKALVDAACDGSGVGIAVPRIVNDEGKLKYSLRRKPTIMRALGEALLGGHRAAQFPLLGDMIRDPKYYVDGATAEWATGAVMFLARSAIDRVGLWDERFFLYSEETDYALRVRDAGLRLIYVESAVAVHPGGSMSKSPALWSLVAVNRTKLYRKRHGPIQSGLYWAVIFFNEGSRAVMGRPTHRAAAGALVRDLLPFDHTRRS